MPLYLSRFSYTPETWARLIGNPEDRGASIVRAHQTQTPRQVATSVWLTAWSVPDREGQRGFGGRAALRDRLGAAWEVARATDSAKSSPGVLSRTKQERYRKLSSSVGSVGE